MVLQNFHHPALGEFDKIWSLSSVPRVRQFTYAIEDVDKRQLVVDVFDAFQREVLPNTAQFSAGRSGAVYIAGSLYTAILRCDRIKFRLCHCL